jgi:branched-subunit amino acid transport protein AzlD
MLNLLGMVLIQLLMVKCLPDSHTQDMEVGANSLSTNIWTVLECLIPLSHLANDRGAWI